MNIRPRNIQKYQGGGTFNLADWIAQNPTYYEWYRGIYPNALVLAGNPLKLNLAHANYSKVSSSHHTTDDLQRSAYNNYLYTSPDLYSAREADIINWAGKNNIDLNTISDLDFVNTYNTQAQTIRDAREAPQTYNRTGYTGTNRTFRNMFGSRSLQGTNQPLYTIGYLENIEDIEGTSTWQRRMDRYQKRFLDDTPENQRNRTFYITRPDGRKIKVYKKENGDLGLFNDPNDPNSPKDPNPEPENPQNPLNPNPNPEPGKVEVGNPGRIGVNQGNWDEKNPLKNLDLNKFVTPALNVGRLWNTLRTNAEVYKHMKKAISPVLQQSYHTYRQITGDEATKQGYYTRAAEGQTKAARPFTSDADRQMAYLMEARRIGDQLRAEGDRADNASIRTTTGESNAHSDENKARDTQVANLNIVSFAQANAAGHQLDAQEASARGTSMDNWLKEIQYNNSKKILEDYAYQNLLDLYDMAYARLNDPERLKLEKIYYDAEAAYSKSKSTEDYNKVNSAMKALKSYDLNWQKNWLVAHPVKSSRTWFFGKRGGRFTFDHDAELLYKVSRDAVKHFREMSKLTDDSRIKTLPKAIKLKDHPKRKLQYGGQAPFMVYTPLALGGGESTTASASGSTKSSGDGKKEKHDTFDVIKDLFKDIAGKGLPSDVSVAYDQMSALLRQAQMSGAEMDSDDLASMYLKQMLIVNNLQFEKAAYDKAKELVTNNKGLGELAVDSSGRLVGQDKDGKIVRKTLSELQNSKEEFTPFTNEQLLLYRAYSPNKAFDLELLQIVNNGVGLEKITEYIRNNIGSIGTTEFLQEGYSKKEAEKLISGLNNLLRLAEATQGAPDGVYKEQILSKQQEEQAMAALQWVYNTLPNNMKTVLSIHGDPKLIIMSAIAGRLNQTKHYSIDAITGKAAKKDGAGSGAGDEDAEKMDPAMAFFMGIGERDTFVILDKTKDGLKIDTISMPMLDASGNGMSNATLQQLKGGQYSGLLNTNLATMGGVRISPNGVNNVLLSGGNIYQTELPIDERALANGIVQPDLSFLKNKEKADEQVRAQGIRDRSNLTEKEIQTINKIYLDNGLPIVYTMDGSGKPKLTSRYRRFAMVDGYATKDAFEGGDLAFNDGIEEISSKQEVDLFENMMQTVTNNPKYKVDRSWLFGTDIYKGIVYIPMVDNTVAALAGTNYKAKPSTYNEIERLQQQSDFSREINYNPAGSFTNN